tara:strand:+ start:412 stop:738 length:327 start_codon:yes stop_codon:yes gene_type:complete
MSEHSPRYDAKLTICSEMRAMGIASDTEAGKRIAWMAGAFVRDVWKAANDGERPKMRLVAKSNGTGTHDKAVYPLIWRERIRREIDRACAIVGRVDATSQLFLFGDGP